MPQPTDIARRLLDVIPPSMQRLRLEMRSGRSGELTVPQFRVVAAIGRGLTRGSELARHLGVSQAAMSKTLAVLVERGMVRGVTDSEDKRQRELELTRRGLTYYRSARARAQESLGRQIARLSEAERETLKSGLATLEKLLVEKEESR